MANEKRLIDANALQFEPDENCIANGVLIWCGRTGGKTMTTVLSALKKMIDNAPTVDAVEAADMRGFAEDVVYQFGYYIQNGGRLHITHGGLSTLEWAFDILGWENPHPVPECECEIEGCHEHATCGTPTADGYKRVCGKHYCNYRAKMDGDTHD